MRKLLALCVCALVCTASLFAQATAGLGAISGTVRDASGAAVPDARVVVSNSNLGLTRELTTTGAGTFVASSLVPSAGYKLTISKQGFTTYEAKDLEIQVGQVMNVNVPLAVGGVTTAVEVSAMLATVDDVKTDVSQVVGNEQIQELPINGRRVDTFVQLTPAVT